MNIEEIIEDLRNQMQTLEDLKTQLSEAQENIRESISILQMIRLDMGDELRKELPGGLPVFAALLREWRGWPGSVRVPDGLEDRGPDHGRKV